MTKHSKFYIVNKVNSEITCSKSLYYIETKQLIWTTGQLSGFNMIQVFTERYFPTDFTQIFPYIQTNQGLTKINRAN